MVSATFSEFSFTWLPPTTSFTRLYFDFFACSSFNTFVTSFGSAPLIAMTLVSLYRASSKSLMMELPVTRIAPALVFSFLRGAGETLAQWPVRSCVRLVSLLGFSILIVRCWGLILVCLFPLPFAVCLFAFFSTPPLRPSAWISLRHNGPCPGVRYRLFGSTGVASPSAAGVAFVGLWYPPGQLPHSRWLSAEPCHVGAIQTLANCWGQLPAIQSFPHQWISWGTFQSQCHPLCLYCPRQSQLMSCRCWAWSVAGMICCCWMKGGRGCSVRHWWCGWSWFHGYSEGCWVFVRTVKGCCVSGTAALLHYLGSKVHMQTLLMSESIATTGHMI